MGTEEQGSVPPKGGATTQLHSFHVRVGAQVGPAFLMSMTSQKLEDEKCFRFLIVI